METIRSQFHYGSIQMYEALYKLQFLIKGLNSTMVRFKCMKQLQLTLNCEIVSIPLWFDSNPNNFTNKKWKNYVSIPLWFDSNFSEQYPNSNPLYVSIPLWFDSNWTDNRSDASCI